MAYLRQITLLLGLALVLAVLVSTPRTAQAQYQPPAPAPCATAAAAALSARGLPYVWGSKGPSSFDCSGLVYWAWTQAGYDVGKSTYDQARQGVEIPCTLSNLSGSATTCWQAGDLILLSYTGGQHVAMYIGNGLFADAYNPATGVIIHDVAGDSFYQAHFWQARRIVSCSGVTVNPGTSSHRLPDNTPGLEELPNLLAPVSFSVTQCGTCTPGSSTALLPPTEWDGQWPSNPLDLGAVFQATISWLAWRMGELLRILICWLLSLLAILASFLETLVNVIVAGINGLWKMLLFFWISIMAWFAAFYALVIDLLAAILAGFAIVGEIFSIILLVIWIALEMIGRVLGMLGEIVGQILGVLGWIGGVSIGMIVAIFEALGGTSVPTQLTTSYVVYQLLRGVLEGIVDSWLGWVIALMWALTYIGFVFWLTRFLSSSQQEEE